MKKNERKQNLYVPAYIPRGRLDSFNTLFRGKERPVVKPDNKQSTICSLECYGINLYLIVIYLVNKFIYT